MPSKEGRSPTEVLDDPVRVADRLAPEHEQRDAILAGQLVDLVAVRLAPRHAPLLAPRSRAASSRATRPHGQSRFVGVLQR